MFKTSGRSFVTTTALFGVGLALIQRVSSASTSNCRAGFTYFSGDVCVGCTAGTYSGPGSLSCSTCPTNTYSRSLASSCTACPSGSISSPGAASCTLQNTCTAGRYFDGMGCVACPVNTYSGPLATSCTACPGQQVSDVGSSSCHACASGTHYDSGSCVVDPVTCPPGHGDGATQCEECPAGQFSWEGAAACCSCCSGFYSDHPGAGSCSQCSTPGAYSVVGATSASACSSFYSGGQLSCPSAGPTCPDVGGASPSSLTRQSLAPRRAARCPLGQRSCPVYGVSADGRGYLRGRECVDVRTDLESCGGCVADDSPGGARSADGGRDCSAIPHTGRVGCRGGACVIESCASGFALSEDGEACVASSAADALHVQRRAAGHRARRSAANF
ncbi:uncharacterized protein BXZ73DRAFT_44243 [Epithele typhae]|uniref:uncharacterized protein n=1 Tax=Epithele typhae TaxID=378194 RepID=UPI0020085B0B|nr:uncharacterized protein BXZ73DRAFT_44243 [Epithele typhae]KAH9939105.1 hypothetical protein BXZ73DRAFT_44243 [Epithele typhae]